MSSTVWYVAELAPEDIGYSVTFPDVPGAITEGDDLAAACANAAEALALILEAMGEAGEPWPTPSDADRIAAEIRGRGAVPYPIAMHRQPKRERINLMFDAELLARVDSAAERAGQTRSAFVEGAARARLRALAEG